jgi:uncharacterized protein
MLLGIISDTHGFLDPKVLELFSGVDHILHAGDVGGMSIVRELEQVAPVTAVLGNTDSMLPFRETEILELDRRKYIVQHIVYPQSPVEYFSDLLHRERPDVVVFGHTHKVFSQVHGGILFFNPGYAGKPRFGMERSVARLRWEGNEIRPEILAL